MVTVKSLSTSAMALAPTAPKTRMGSRMPGCQSGVSLMMVLICLAIMSVAAVGLIRMVDTGSLIVGNVAFKQSATSAADRGAQHAITNVLAENMSGDALFNDLADQGYYATSIDNLDPLGNRTEDGLVLVNWEGAECSGALCIEPSNEVGVNGYRVQYVITRLCRQAGDPNAASNSCSRPVAATGAPSSSRGEGKYGEHERFRGEPSSPFFRIITRSVGPRNTVSFTETYVYF